MGDVAMTPEQQEAAVMRWEGGLIIQTARVADVQAKLMKQLVRGRMESELRGAYMDLRNIANAIEKLAGELP